MESSLRWLVLVALLCAVSSTRASTYPTWTKLKAPYTDRCFSLAEKGCKNAAKYPECQWFAESDTPRCANKNYYKVKPPEYWDTKVPSLVSMFFEFSFGVHLSEGTLQRFYYNVDLDTCGRLCLQSAGGLEDDTTYGNEIFGTPLKAYKRVRCLSFEMYPFETPETAAPFHESSDRGVCVLNSGNKDTARLRAVDQSFTDSEFFSSSFCERRPSSALEGYYEIRDSRGDGLSTMLNYVNDGELANMVTAWGGSRWGSTTLSVPEPLESSLRCHESSAQTDVLGPHDVENPKYMYSAGFTPVGENQRCTGKVTKERARSLCTSLGAQLCPTQADIDATRDLKLGCSYDNDAIWSEDQTPSHPLNDIRYPRCCGYYSIPVKCDDYERANTRTCSSFTRASDCIWGGSGTGRQATLGFGRGLTRVRNHCTAAIAAGRPDCRNLLIQTWTMRGAPGANCIWCPRAGDAPGGGAGVCRPGGDYGVCPNSGSTMRNLFSLGLRSSCRRAVMCNLVADDSSLADLFP